MMPILIIAAAVAVAYMMTRKQEDEQSSAALAEMLCHEDSSGGEARVEMSGVGDFKYKFVPSPNKSSRNGKKATTLVWHYTAGKTAAGAISWLCDPISKASAHFVVDRNGTITQLVPLADSAWHVGNAKIAGATTIGVEIVNIGWLLKTQSGWTDQAGAKVVPDMEPVQATLRFKSGLVKMAWWLPYTEAQYGAIIGLCANLASSPWAAALQDQAGHADIATPDGRKWDPGPLFNWERISSFDQRKRLVTTQSKGII